jgi:ribosomal protein L11 methyltransferase
MTNHCLTIGPCPRALAEKCAARLEMLDRPRLAALSLYEFDARGLWQVDAYYATEEESGVAAAIAASLGIPAGQIRLTFDSRTDWVSESLKNLKPVRAGRFFVHGSHDRDRKPANGVSIEIDAATAFGTGHHATTLGCLLCLDHLLKLERPRNIVDVGCGSGILAIAAAKATRRGVLATDIDPEAVRVTAANARRNEAKLLVLSAAGMNHPEVRNAAPFDLILANILAKPLQSLASVFAELSAGSSHLILSGLLDEQRHGIETVYRYWGFRLARLYRLQGWCTLLLHRKKITGRRPGDDVVV